MKDGNHIIARVADSHMPTCIMESEVRRFCSRVWRHSPLTLIVNLGPFAKQIATMQWVQERTSIPVPKILAYQLDHSHALGAHIFLEKARFCFFTLWFV